MAAARIEIPRIEDVQRSLKVYESLGLQFQKVTAEEVVASMTVDQRNMQPWGVLHGGVTALIAESLGSIGASMAAKGKPVVGIDIQCSHLRAVPVGKTIIATARPVKIGRTIHFWEVRVEEEVDDADNQPPGSGSPDIEVKGNRPLVAICRLLVGVGLGKPRPVHDPGTRLAVMGEEALDKVRARL